MVNDVVVNYCMLSHLDDFEALCGNRKKGFKIVETLTGPRIQGLYEGIIFLRAVINL